MTTLAAGVAQLSALTRDEIAAIARLDAGALSTATAAKSAVLAELAQAQPDASDPHLPQLLAEARSLTDALALRLRLLARRESRRQDALAGLVKGTA